MRALFLFSLPLLLFCMLLSRSRSLSLSLSDSLAVPHNSLSFFLFSVCFPRSSSPSPWLRAVPQSKRARGESHGPLQVRSAALAIAFRTWRPPGACRRHITRQNLAESAARHRQECGARPVYGSRARMKHINTND